MLSTLDVLVIGAGPIGLVQSLALKHASPTLSVGILDRCQIGEPRKDHRASAITEATRRMFTALQVWPKLEKNILPIQSMEITDSSLNDMIRPSFLSFSREKSDFKENLSLAYMVMNTDLLSSLEARASEVGVIFLEPGEVSGYYPNTNSVICSDGRQLEAQLMVAADGAQSKLRSFAGIKTVTVPYGQAALVTTIGHERSHGGKAFEHFLPGGPFAILPLPDDMMNQHRSSIVWTEREEDASSLVSADEESFSYELERRFGRQWGALKRLSPIQIFPLSLQLARAFVRPGLALVGDSAHRIHPIAGQGLNLGFKDAAALTQVVTQAYRLGLSCGDWATLEEYQRWRRFDTVAMGITTDLLNRFFSNDVPLLRVIRRVGLGLVDRFPAFKDYFMQEATGLNEYSPNLLKGLSI